MSRLAASFVLGYHGCAGEIARQAVNGELALLQSEKKYLRRQNIELVRLAHREFVKEQKRSKLPIPENRSLDGEPDKILRFLDRAVIQLLHEIFEESGESFDSVRGLFPEGEELYAGAGFRSR